MPYSNTAVNHNATCGAPVLYPFCTMHSCYAAVGCRAQAVAGSRYCQLHRCAEIDCRNEAEPAERIGTSYTLAGTYRTCGQHQYATQHYHFDSHNSVGHETHAPRLPGPADVPLYSWTGGGEYVEGYPLRPQPYPGHGGGQGESLGSSPNWNMHFNRFG
ncbi:hypothetical protein VTK73DRAFT_99 [Phialemonium thermophilum]|uniref:Uncharacterized protein n=1 Tax=Phialemonium thermophilum TaxID=223376 RepID=A0ABR3Y5M4_9PEZI